MAKFQALLCAALLAAVATATARPLGGSRQLNTAADNVAALVIGAATAPKPKDREFTVLLEAVVAAGLADTLSNPDLAVTVFAPTDAAFVRALGILGKTKAQLLADKPTLTKLLQYHVVPSPIRSSQLKFYQNTPTLLGSKFDSSLAIIRVAFLNYIRVLSSSWVTARVVTPDLLAGKSVVHVVNNVLIPRSLMPKK